MIVVITGLVVDATKADGDSFYADINRLDNVAVKIHQELCRGDVFQGSYR